MEPIREQYKEHAITVYVADDPGGEGYIGAYEVEGKRNAKGVVTSGFMSPEQAAQAALDAAKCWIDTE